MIEKLKRLPPNLQKRLLIQTSIPPNQEPPSKTRQIKTIEGAIQRKDLDALKSYFWYIHYKILGEQEHRALVLPVDSDDLPVVPILGVENPNLDLSLIRFWNLYIKPQQTEAQFMLFAIESMYRKQQRFAQDVGKVTFSIALTQQSYAEKLGYISYLYPNNPKLEWDHVCENCGGVSRYNFVTDLPACLECKPVVK